MPSYFLGNERLKEGREASGLPIFLAKVWLARLVVVYVYTFIAGMQRANDNVSLTSSPPLN